MEIDEAQQKQLRAALLSAFPTREELEIMVSDQLKQSLSVIAGNSDLEYTIFQLIQKLKARGRLEELVDAALKQNGQNPQLIIIAKQLELKKNPIQDVPKGENTERVPPSSVTPLGGSVQSDPPLRLSTTVESVFQPDQASVLVEKATLPSQLSSSSGPQNEANDLYIKGKAASLQKDLELALQYWAQIPSLDPNFLGGMFTADLQELRVQYLRNEVEKAQSQQDWQKASSHLQELLRLESSNDDLKRNFVEYLNQKTKNAKEAKAYDEEINIWKKIVEIEPTNEARAQCLRLQAERASLAGDWEQEISLWKELLELVPQDAQAKRRFSLAEKNQKEGAPLYKFAQGLFSEGNTLAAKAALKALWKVVAPYYGDPVGLAKKLGIAEEPLTPADYDKAEEAVRKTRKWFINNTLSSNTLTVYISFLCLLIGFSSLVNILAQSWHWAIPILDSSFNRSWYWPIIAEVLIALFAYILGYRRAMSAVILLLLVVISSIATLGIAEYLSTLSYDIQQPSQLWLFGNKPLWIGRQIKFGVFYGIFLGLGAIGVAISKERLSGAFVGGLIMMGVALVVWYFPASIGSWFGLGFGWGYGWHISIVALLITIICGIGIGAWIFVANRRSR